MKITYDLNNKEECQEIEDYYFFKYYRKCLFFDWKKIINRIIIDNDYNILFDIKYKCIYKENELLNNILSEVIKSINEVEFRRFKDILIKTNTSEPTAKYLNDDKYILLYSMYWSFINVDKYKHQLYKKYGEKI